MWNHSASTARSIAAVALGLAMLACSIQAARPPSEAAAPAIQPAATLPILTLTANPAEAVPSQTPAAAAIGSPQPVPVVTVAAVGGRLNVRRGPGSEYDTVGAFREGQNSTATARNADGTWLYINIPLTSKVYGWITIKTQYTSVSGNAAALPVMAVPPAALAYIRNCTGHQMVISPGGAILEDRDGAPDNQLQFNPGEYTVYDDATSSSVGGLTVFEGKITDIKTDGSGKKFTCP